MESNISIANFWPRVGALLIDGIILAAIGFVLGLTIDDFLIGMGNYGPLFGMFISVVYQTIFNSKLLDGQTPGKMIVKIQVVDSGGNTIGIDKALLRSLAFSAPFFLASVPIPGVPDMSAVNIIRSAAMITWGIGIVVVYLSNVRTRQSLHDLIVGTWVVNLERKQVPAPLPQMTKTPFLIFGATAAAFIAGVAYLNFSVPQLQQSRDLYTKVSEVDGVIRTGVSYKTSFGRTEVHSLELSIWVKNLPAGNFENDKIMHDVLSIVLKDEPDLNKYDVISINAVRGFNIGIASRQHSKRVSQSPASWSEVVY